MAAAFVLTAAPAAACPMVGFDDAALVPSDGATDVALDTALVIPIDPGQHRDCWFGFISWPEWSVTVAPEGGSAVPGSMAYFDRAQHCKANPRELIAWRPSTALSPNTPYTVEVVYDDAQSGKHVLQSSFTTGSAMLPSLVVSGNLGINMMIKTTYSETCLMPNSCGGAACTVTPGPKAVYIRTGGLAISGGQEANGYDVDVLVGIGAPQTNFYPSTVRNHVGPGVPITLEALLPDLGEEYTPCVSVAGWDATGRQTEPVSVCLDPIDPGKLVGKIAGDASPGSPTSATPDSDDGSGCAVAPAPQHPPWPALLLVLRLFRRRREAGEDS